MEVQAHDDAFLSRMLSWAFQKPYKFNGIWTIRSNKRNTFSFAINKQSSVFAHVFKMNTECIFNLILFIGDIWVNKCSQNYFNYLPLFFTLSKVIIDTINQTVVIQLRNAIFNSIFKSSFLFSNWEMRNIKIYEKHQINKIYLCFKIFILHLLLTILSWINSILWLMAMTSYSFCLVILNWRL